MNKNRMKKMILIAILGLSAYPFANAKEIGSAPEIRVAVSKYGANLILKNKTLKLHALCDCARINKAQIISHTKRAKNYYVVLTISGPSQEANVSSYCGAGTEENLVWLKLDNKLRVLDSKKYLVESCYKSVDRLIDRPVLSLNLETKKMQGQFNSYAQMMSYSVSYDPAMPEKGFSVTSEAIVDK
jgi:hypothetical protein